jgi:Fic family protein
MSFNRSYEQTHPWLTFQLDLRKLPHNVWLNLGEAQSTCQHIAGVPLRPETAKELHQLYLAKGVHATTAIEGNTLSEKEVLKIVQGESKVSGSKEYLAQEVQNIIDACNQIGTYVFDQHHVGLSVARVNKYNALVLKNLTLEPHIQPGVIRTYPVGVARYKAAPAEDCEYLLDRLCQWLNTEFPVKEEERTALGIVKAIVAHVYFAWIHPYGDGNGRTARLLEFEILLHAKVPSASAHLLSNHYNQTRQEYYRHLENASKSPDALISFIEYAVRGFIDGLRDQLLKIREQQWSVAWRNYIHELFTGTSASDQRKRHLVLDLSTQPEPVPFAKLRELSARIAAAYAHRSVITLTRDINVLLKLDLVERTPKGYRAKQEKILAFLPATKKA